jgi:hypothetical protein
LWKWSEGRSALPVGWIAAWNWRFGVLIVKGAGIKFYGEFAREQQPSIHIRSVHIDLGARHFLVFDL